MRKHLLLFMALMSGLAANAANEGDYIYTATSRLKVTGANIVTNGNFASNSTEGWHAFASDGSATDVDMSKWTLVPNGKDGVNTIKSSNVADMNMYQSIQLSEGNTYVVSFDIKATSAATSATALGSTNTISMFVNNDGSISSSSDGYRLISDSYSIPTEWTTISDTIVVNEGTATTLQVVFQNMAEGTEITNLEVHTMNTVYDDRILKREIDWVEYVHGLPNWAEANSDGKVHESEEYPYSDIMAAAKEAYASAADGGLDDEATGTDLVANLELALSDFLAANSADMADNFKSWTSTTTKYQKATKINDWVLTSGRWFHCNGTYTDEEKARIFVDISGAYNLPTSTATLTKSGWAPGKYAFFLDAKGYFYAGKSKAIYYTPNYDSNFTGMSIFANGDTTQIEEALPTRYYQRFVKFFEVGEDGVLNVGAKWENNQTTTASTYGGNWSIANPKIVKLGADADSETRKLAIANVLSAQNSLRVMLDSAINVSNYEMVKYPWGKQALKDSIALGEEDYQLGLAVVDANGNVLNEEALKTDGEYVASPQIVSDLNTSMKYVQAALKAFYSTNKPYTNLVADVAKAKDVYNDATLNGSADRKATLKSLIEQSDALIAAVSAELENGTEFTELDTKLNEARQSYLNSAASYDTPATVDITGFTSTSSSTPSGWTLTANDTSKELFKTTADAEYESGYRAYVWRGSIVSPNSKLAQKVTLTDKGIYEFKAKAYAFNEAKSYDAYMATITTDEVTGVNDTTYNQSQVKLFFGLDGAPDSVMVHSRNHQWVGSAFLGTTQYIPSEYSVYYVKTTDEAETIEFGMSSYGQVDKQGANGFGFGDPAVTFYGDNTSDYKNKLYASLQSAIKEADEIINADTLANSSLLESGRVFAVNRAVKALNAAKAVTVSGAKAYKAADASFGAKCKEISEAKHALAAAMVTFNSIATGIQGVNEVTDEAPVKASVKGVYNLSGIKVAESAESLPAGFYIINGKKVIVK